MSRRSLKVLTVGDSKTVGTERIASRLALMAAIRRIAEYCPAEVEERVINSDTLDAEDPAIDADQQLLGGIGRCAIDAGGVFRGGQGAGVEVAADR